MRTKTEVVTVVFRYEEDGGVYALFPYICADNIGNCLTYAHIGQHSAADFRGCVARSRPATEAEYLPLKRELESIGYQLRIR